MRFNESPMFELQSAVNIMYRTYINNHINVINALKNCHSEFNIVFFALGDRLQWSELGPFDRLCSDVSLLH